MPLSSPWRDLELRFRSLQDQYGDSLQASWWPASKPHGGKWQLLGSTNPAELDQFKTLAEQAAIALGQPPGARAVWAWLDVLKAYSPSYLVVAPPTSLTTAGRIDRLHEASADQCVTLNAKTIEFPKPPPGLISMSRWGSYLTKWTFQRRMGMPYSFEQFLLEEAQEKFLSELKVQTLDRSEMAPPDTTHPPAVKGGRKGGRRPDLERQSAIRGSMSKHGSKWRANLAQILTELDEQLVPLGGFEGMKIDLGDGESHTVTRWEDLDLAQGKQRHKIIDAFRRYLR